MPRPLIIAHRGVAAPNRFENTIESFEKAIQLGADMIEFDVRKSRDGQLIVHHDATIDGQMINQLTLNEINRNAGLRGFEVPTLVEVLHLTKSRIRLDVEMKEEGYEDELVEILLQNAAPEQFIITSFLDNSLMKIKMDYPQIKSGLLIGFHNPICSRCYRLAPIRRANCLQVDYLLPNWRLLKFGILQRAHKINLPLIVWTVNEKTRIDNLIKKGVAGIITDNAELMLQ
jgi:glycerophosphoryl diester phosphodiesterase